MGNSGSSLRFFYLQVVVHLLLYHLLQDGGETHAVQKERVLVGGEGGGRQWRTSRVSSHREKTALADESVKAADSDIHHLKVIKVIYNKTHDGQLCPTTDKYVIIYLISYVCLPNLYVELQQFLNVQIII